MFSRKQLLLVITLLLIAIVFVTGCRLASLPTLPIAKATATPGPVPTATVSSSTASLSLPANAEAVTQAEEQLMEAIYRQVGPAVVNIHVTSEVKVPAFPTIPEIPGFPSFPFPQQPREFKQQALGSGFVYDLQGHIVTNFHVVKNATDIAVTFSDDVTAPAKIVGTDPDSDLAVIQVDVDASELHPVELGDSESLAVGQLVFAIGNPFGLQGTMTRGIISALGRSLPAQSSTADGGHYTIPDVIQTDAAINPGNSGGPLLDAHGRVIGVNTAIQSPVRGSSGIGFAVPSAIVRQVVPELIAHGKYKHPWLGIGGVNVTAELAKQLGLPANQRGVLVGQVVPDSPADKAGLQATKIKTINGERRPKGGDIIVAIDDQPVHDFDDLTHYLVRKTRVGQTVRITVLRNGEKKVLSVKLGERPHGKS